MLIALFKGLEEVKRKQQYHTNNNNNHHERGKQQVRECAFATDVRREDFISNSNWSRERSLRRSQSRNIARSLEEVAEHSDENLIFGSDDDGSSFGNSFPDSPGSPSRFLGGEEQGMGETLSPPRRPAIYDEETGEGKLLLLVVVYLFFVSWGNLLTFLLLPMIQK